MKLVVLDRDGVINYDSDQYIKHPEEWRPIPGSPEAIALLNQAGFRVALATNQSGVGRGLLDMATLNEIHGLMFKVLSQAGARIDAFFYCPHQADVQCDCRKPKSGMLEEIGRRFHTTLVDVPCVGDSLRDLQAAAKVGGQPLLVRTGNGEKTKAAGGLPENTLIFEDLADAVRYVVSRS